jgi:Skp family chaperone for outer membrane proteins
VIEAQASGRPSPAALETTDARNELVRVRGELDNIDSERKVLRAKLDEKEKLVDDLSARLSVLEKAEQSSGSAQARTQNGNSGSGESESRLIARINQLTQQLETEKQKNRTLKGA